MYKKINNKDCCLLTFFEFFKQSYNKKTILDNPIFQDFWRAKHAARIDSVLKLD